MKLGIVGYGKMGRGIFNLFFKKKYDVSVIVRSEKKAFELKEKAIKKWERYFKRDQISKKNIKENILQKKISFTNNLEELYDRDVVIETVNEDFILKKNIFNKIQDVVKKNTLLLTNTSSISIDKLSEGIKGKERFCGFHFFYPVLLIQLTEIIKSNYTSYNTLIETKKISEKINKQAIVVKDGPGSVINGILIYYYAEAVYLLEEGVAKPSFIDKAARRHFYIGPCESIDTIGIQLILNGLSNAPKPGKPSIIPIRIPISGKEHLSNKDLGGRPGFYFPPLLNKLKDNQRFGKSLGKGIYIYQGSIIMDDDISYYLNDQKYISGNRKSLDEDMVSQRLLYSIFNGSLWALKEKYGSQYDIDVGIREVLQMTKGPMTVMKKMGYEKVKTAFKDLYENGGKRFYAPGLETLFLQA